MKRALLLSTIWCGLAGFALAQTPFMVKDIKTGWPHSYPFSLVNLNGILLFSAEDGVVGRELWKSDGTAAGTSMVKDIYVGPNHSMVIFSNQSDYMTPFNGKVYFAADNGSTGIELFMTDGTDSGTVLVKDINPGTNDSGPKFLTVFGNTLYFVADDGLLGEELWKSDGTESGTVLVKDINPGSGSSIYSVWGWDIPALVEMGSYIYFPANDGNAIGLWRSDGTLAGTTLVSNISASSLSPQFLTNVNGTLFFNGSSGFNSDRELYKSDGTDAGTVLVKDIAAGSGSSAPSQLVNVNGTLFFSADNGSSGVGDELWKSDGTDAGTVLVKDINLGTGSSGISQTFAFQNKLIFSADNVTNGRELWISDGTDAGTTLLKDINSGPSDSNPYSFLEVGGAVYFGASPSPTLWYTDGTTTGTYSIGASSPKYMTNVNGVIFFQGYSGDYGAELWAFGTPVAIDPSEKEKLSVSIFPNPTKGEITIIIPEKAIGKTGYTITDMMGRKVAGGNLISPTTPIRLTATDGLYFVTVSNSTKSHTEKIVVRH